MEGLSCDKVSVAPEEAMGGVTHGCVPGWPLWPRACSSSLSWGNVYVCVLGKTLSHQGLQDLT